MKTCFVCDWLTVFSGAEKVLEQMYKIYPSPIYTLFGNLKAIENTIFSQEKIVFSFLQKFYKILSYHSIYAPLFPFAIEQFDLSAYDLIFSSSHCVAKGIIPSPESVHICYCHTPMRYIWDLSPLYIHNSKKLFRVFARYLFYRFRTWDVISANRVDYFIANSNFVSKRIEKYYRRTSSVIYPPVDTQYFSLYEKKESFFLTASRLVSYKNIEAIVQAFSLLKEKTLIVIGNGPEKRKLKTIATKNVQILDYQSPERLRYYLQRAQAFIFNSIEDFGILPVEAQSTGTPVIALKKGGAKETVVEGVTGVFYAEPTPEKIIEAIKLFERKEFHYHTISEHAQKFSVQRFAKEMKEYVTHVYSLKR